jgi:serine/threonine-protein kinase RsbT
VESFGTAITVHAPAAQTVFTIGSDGDILAARQHGRSYVLQLGFSSPEATLVAAAISELARNIVMYAKEGEITLQPLEQNGRAGVLIIARDDGPGISAVQRAAIEAVSLCDGVVLGLRGVKRLVDELEIESRAGQGTRVALKKWKA